MLAVDYVKRYEALCACIAGLRLHRDVAEAEMLCAILHIGDNPEDMHALALAGCDSLERFCKTNEFCDPTRFRAFAGGVAKIGRDRAVVIGAEATIQAAKLTDSEERRTTYVDSLVAWREQHAGAAASQQTARRIRMQVDPIPELPRSLRTKTALGEAVDHVAKLEAENARLRVLVDRLQKERDALKATVQQLRRQKKPGSKKSK